MAESGHVDEGGATPKYPVKEKDEILDGKDDEYTKKVIQQSVRSF